MTQYPPAGGGGNRLYCEIDGMRVGLDAADLSPAGLFVQTTAALEPDSDVDIYLRTPIGQMTARGIVVQAISYARAVTEGRKPGFGLLFANLDDDQRRLLEGSIEALAEPTSRRAVAGSSGARAKAARRRHIQQSMPARSCATPSPVPRDAPGAAHEAPGAMGAEAAETLRRLEGELSSISLRSPWAILGLDSGSDSALARDAYFAASKRYHPHRFARFDSDAITHVVTELFIAHKRAYTTIQQASSAPPAGASADAGVGCDARGQVASLRPRRRRQSDAVSLVNEGMRCLATSRFADAEACFTRALEKQENAAQAALWLSVCRARRAHAEGETEAAVQHYRAALELDPTNKEAQEGSKATQKKSGLLGRLFKVGSG